MDADKLFAALERFFLDIVGLLIPGALLLVGVWSLFQPLTFGALSISIPTSGIGTWLAVAAAYVAGHAVATMGSLVTSPATVWLYRPIAWLRSKTRGRSEALKSVVTGRRALNDRIAQRRAAIGFVQLVRPGTVLSADDIHEWRNVAMTRLRAEDKATVVRVMFLSMLNLGVATVLWLLGATVVLGRLIEAVPHGARTTWNWSAAGAAFIVAAIALLASFPFLHRHFEFYDRTMRLPFDMAYATATDPTQRGTDNSKQGESVSPSNRSSSGRWGPGPLRVYLAGGHRSAWRARIVAAVPHLVYFNPAAHELQDPAAYTAWDLEGIRQCDVVFGYLELTNPSGIGLATELGFAAALGKHVLFVDEKTKGGDPSARYLGLVRHTANVSFDDLDVAVAYLKNLALLSPGASSFSPETGSAPPSSPKRAIHKALPDDGTAS